jgi:hypothetical protein
MIGALCHIGEHAYLRRFKTFWREGTCRDLETPDDRAHEPQECHLRPALFFERDRRGAPAGTYTVETDEELIPGLSFPAYRRIVTLIFLRSRRGGPVVEEVANIDPLELQAAQERDAGPQTPAGYHSGYLGQNNGLMN